MEKNAIIQNLEIIKSKLLNISVKGADVFNMADAIAGIEQTEQLLIAEPKKAEPKKEEKKK